MSEQPITQTDIQKLQKQIDELKLENQQLSAAVLLLEQLISAFAVDLNPQDRVALIDNINNNFLELGAADTIPLSPTPSRPSMTLNIAKKLHEMSSVSDMFSQKKDILKA